MKKIVIITLCGFIASCATSPTQKVNVLTDANNEIQVTPPKCPDWTGGNGKIRSIEPEETTTNYGCATVTNFGKMIDDPMDMLTGKSSEYYDGQTTANAVHTSRTPVAAGTSTGTSASQ